MATKIGLSRVSIVIPAYNEERYIGACLDSIAAQSQAPFEVIVVDNNSSDRTAEIAAKYPFVRVIREPCQGRVFARNAGFDVATGDIIGRIDADTRLPANWVAYIQQFYADPAHDMTAWTGGCIFYNVRFPRFQGWGQGQIAFRWNRLLLGHHILFGSNMALPREVWEKTKPHVCLRNDIHEDLDLAIHVHERGFPITYHEGVRVAVRMSGAVISPAQHRQYMMLWPNTLRFHHHWTWVFGWLGAMTLWIITPLEGVVDAASSILGRTSRIIHRS